VVRTRAGPFVLAKEEFVVSEKKNFFSSHFEEKKYSNIQTKSNTETNLLFNHHTNFNSESELCGKVLSPEPFVLAKEEFVVCGNSNILTLY